MSELLVDSQGAQRRALLKAQADIAADAVKREYEAKIFPLPEHAVARS